MAYPDFTPARDCVSCGLCLPHCPTYRERPFEMASPRGRIQLIKGLATGELTGYEALDEHLSLCLACRACESACPSAVKFGSLIESARAVLNDRLAPSWGRRLGAFFMRHVFPHQRRLAAVAALMRAYQASGLQRLFRETPLRGCFPERIVELESMMPEMSPLGEMPAPRGELEPYGVERGRVGFLTGCVMQLAMASTNAASMDVLRFNGLRVVLPREQRCCGALHLHNGFIPEARALARANIAAFEEAGVDWIVTNQAGCGSTLKEYGKLLDDEPDWAGRAEAFRGRVRDINELLVELGLRPPSGRLALRAVYDDPCHLVHGQKIKAQPRQLLRAIPGLELAEAREADWCCGSAGIYNVTHTEMSLAILQRKMDDLLSTRPDVIVTSNPGCAFQLRYGARRAGHAVQVVHVMDLLARSYRGEGAGLDRSATKGEPS
ncbi:MAG: 4Fe-4S dicluster domain-containing protein [Candidatus Wallbacteria bacterium]|nr:4Fe-4S dicluster domain-containing protein [Candidatus Wallbacteria bacterium]